jgi:hypothetical protein
MISPPWTPWCSSICIDVIVLDILWRTSRCSCLNWLYWMLHYLCKNYCVTSYHLMWAFLITSKSWVLNIQLTYRFKVILCTKLDSGLMAGIILRQVYGKMSLKTIIHTISHQLINQSILSHYWSFTFSKSCNNLTSRYNASMNRYNVSTNRYNAFRRYQICQKIGQYGVKNVNNALYIVQRFRKSFQRFKEPLQWSLIHVDFSENGLSVVNILWSVITIWWIV